MEIVILDFSSIKHEAERLYRGAASATQTGYVMDKILADMFEVEAQIFASEGRRGGGSWKPLKPETLKRKIRKNHRTEILRETDVLMESMTVPGAEFQIADVTNSEISFGTDRPGAVAQQFGYSPRNLPARPFVRFTSFDVDRWAGMIMDHLMVPFV